MTNSVTRAGKSGERGARLKSVEGGRGAPVIHEEVYERLRRAIIAGQFEPGKSLSVRGLAAEFGVSAMPAREAIRRLAALGALEVTETRRVMVAHMTPERFDELTIARRTLEPEIAALAARKLAKDAKIRDALIAKLKTIDAALDEAIARGDIADYGRRNSEFHFAFIRRPKRRFFSALLRACGCKLARSCASSSAGLARPRSSISTRKRLRRSPPATPKNLQKQCATTFCRA
ncbi:MAG: GntR family transcriptional regulator [Parvularculaceae bacterium]